MALLDESVNNKKLDVRMIERNISRGVVTPEEFEKAQKKLPDDTENAQWVSIESLVGDREDTHVNGQATSH